MLKRASVTLVLLSVIILLFSQASQAVLLVTTDYWSGYRSTPDTAGIVAGDGWTEAEGGFKISWNITFADGVYTYSYNLTNMDDELPLDPELSHWILEVSDIINTDNISDYLWNFSGGAPGSDEPRTFSAGGSNPDIPSEIYGIKFEPGNSVTFESSQAPIWGDFYAKDGRHEDIWATAWNTGFGNDPDDTTPESELINWIPTPDTETSTIPEPSIVFLLGSLLIVIGIIDRKLL